MRKNAPVCYQIICQKHAKTNYSSFYLLNFRGRKTFVFYLKTHSTNFISLLLSFENTHSLSRTHTRTQILFFSRCVSHSPTFTRLGSCFSCFCSRSHLSNAKFKLTNWFDSWIINEMGHTFEAECCCHCSFLFSCAKKWPNSVVHIWKWGERKTNRLLQKKILVRSLSSLHVFSIHSGFALHNIALSRSCVTKFLPVIFIRTHQFNIWYILRNSRKHLHTHTHTHTHGHHSHTRTRNTDTIKSTV